LLQLFSLAREREKEKEKKVWQSYEIVRQQKSVDGRGRKERKSRKKREKKRQTKEIDPQGPS